MQPRLHAALPRRLGHESMRLAGLARALETVSPLATVARGYAILQQENQHVVRSVEEVRTGDHLTARLHDGTLRLKVDP